MFSRLDLHDVKFFNITATNWGKDFLILCHKVEWGILQRSSSFCLSVHVDKYGQDFSETSLSP